MLSQAFAWPKSGVYNIYMDAALIAQERKGQYLALIIDKDAIWSGELSQSLSQYLQVVVVSAREAKGSSVIHVPFVKQVPHIPDAHYSHIFFVWNRKISREFL